MHNNTAALRVATRWVQAKYFEPGDIVLMGKWKNKRGKVIGFGVDKWGNPTVEIEPIPKGRKQNKIFGLFRIWKAEVKENALAEIAKEKAKLAAKKPDELLYAAVVLDEPSQAKLLKWWKEAVGPLHVDTEAHHMTIQVKPDLGAAQVLPLGRTARLKVIGYSQDDKNQVVAVKASVDTDKAVPHITVALGSGGQARDSDTLLAHGFERVNGPTLTGEVGIKTKRRVIFDLKRLR